MKKLLIITTALVAFGAGPAHAGPAAAAIGAVASWVGSSIAAGGFLGAALRIGLSVGMSLLASSISGKKSSGATGADVNFDITFGDDAPLSFIVGRYVTAGKRKYINTWGKNHRYVTDVIEVSCLPHESLENIWVDDEVGTVLSSTDTDGTGYNLGHPVTNYDDAGDDGTGHRIWVRWMDGTQTAADPMLVALFGDDEDYPWTSDMVGTGKSYAIVTTRYDEETLTSYPTYLFEPSPLPMYDPRRDSTTGGTGSHRWGDRSTYEPSTNPAVIAYNIIRGIYFGTEWVFGGKNLAAWRLPRAEWVAAMNECDASVTLSGGGTERAYRCGAEITVDATAADVLEEIGKAGNMRFAEVGGRMKPLVSLPGTSVFSLTDADIIITEGQSFAPFYPVSQTFNTLTATYPEPAEKWATKDAPEYQDSDSLTEDGDRYLPTSLTYGAAPFANQVQRLMRAQMRDYRRMRTHTFSLPPDAYALEPLDMVTWDSARNGYEGKKFVVESVTKAAGMNVAVSLREVDPSDYDWSTDFELPYTTVVPTNVIPWTQGISGWTAEAVVVTDNAGTGREVGIRVSCAAGEVGIDRVRIQVRKSGDTNPTLDVIRAYDAPYQWTITGVAQQTTYQVRGKLVSKNTAKSVWSDWITVTTPKITVAMDDLSQEIEDTFTQIATEHGVDTVSTLPASGARDDQIVLNMSDHIIYRWDADAGIWSTELYAGVPDGYLDIAKFAQGIEPVSVIESGSLPTAKSTSTIVFGGDLYRWNGTAYVKSVSATDIAGTLAAAQIESIAASQVTGQLTNAQIAAVAAAKLTGSITGTQIADGAIATANLAAGSVTTAIIAAGAVTADDIAANAVTSAKILAGSVSTAALAAGSVSAAKLAANSVTADALAANSVTADAISANAITAGKISAGAIGADQIAAGAVTASKMVLSNFENAFAGWVAKASSPFQPSGWGGSWSTVQGYADPYGGIALSLDAGLGYATSQNIQVTPGEQYYFEFYASKSAAYDGTSVNSKLRVGDGATGSLLFMVTYGSDEVVHFQNSSGWTKRSGTWTVPSGTSSIRITLGHDGTDGNVFLAAMQMRALNKGELIVDGAVTANKIAAGSITSNHLTAGSVLASAIAAGAVTASKINVSSLSAISADLGSIVVDTAHIQDLSVGTIKIANNAITTMATINQSNVSFSASYSNAWTDVYAVSISGSTGDRGIAMVNFTFSTTHNVNYRVLLNGSVLPYGSGGGVGSDVVSFTYGVSLSAGTNTLKIQAQGNNNDNNAVATFGAISLAILRAMK